MMIRFLRAARCRVGREGGFTLAEMVVVIGILGLIMAMAQGALIATDKTVAGNQARNDQTQQAKVAVEAMSKSLRTAILPTQLSAVCATCAANLTAFIQGDTNYVIFYANLNNDYTVAPGPGLSDEGPSKVSYYIQSGDLWETIRRPDLHGSSISTYTYDCVQGSTGCTVRDRILAKKVVTTTPIFGYYQKDGVTQIATPLEDSALRLAAVDSIDIYLTVKLSKQTKGSSVTIRVQLPNVDSLSVPTPSATP
jgi:prepilin-type N-terminal cleavage/methylation domain-containing protein